MEKYNYECAVRTDVSDWLKEHEYTSKEKAQEDRDYIYERMWVSSVTGNASGSYTFSTWQAEENICHNSDLIEEVGEVFGIDDERRNDAEYLDVSIRCYLLGSVLDMVIDEMND